MNKMYRNTYAKINLDAIKHNLAEIQANLGNKKEIIPVLKANAYGHGSVEIARCLEEENYNFFAVALLEEAIELREAGVKASILILGWVSPNYVHLAIKHNFILTAFQTEWLNSVKKLYIKGKLNIHIKIDTGMGRNGINNEISLKKFISTVKHSSFIQVKGVYTHFATADQKNKTYYTKQIKEWKEYLTIINKYYSIDELMIHIGNSGSSIQYPDEMTHYSRIGVSIYGMYPSNVIKKEVLINLKPALELKSEIVNVKQTRGADKIGYGCTYIAEKGDWIGTVAIGYADGWLRKLESTEVLVKGVRMKIIGRICMDMLMIKLDKPYDIGTEVTLIGQSGHEFISVDEIAYSLKTINYEITTNLSSRIPRIYQ